MSFLFSKRDFLAGALMTLIGAAFLALSLNYPLGSARNIGAGAFPAIVAALLVLVGLAMMVVVAAMQEAPRIDPGSLRPVVLVLAAIVLFALLLPTAGYVVATVALIVVSARAHPRFSWAGALGLSALVVVFGAAVFIYGLGLPLALVGPALRF